MLGAGCHGQFLARSGKMQLRFREQFQTAPKAGHPGESQNFDPRNETADQKLVWQNGENDVCSGNGLPHGQFLARSGKNCTFWLLLLPKQGTQVSQKL